MEKKVKLRQNKVLVFNECFSSNFGDQAIDQTLTKLLNDNGIESQSVYLSRPKWRHLPNFDYGDCKTQKHISIVESIKGSVYFVYWYIINRVTLKNLISKYSTFIIGGGQLLNTGKKFYPNTFSIALFWITRLISKKPNYNIYYLGVGTAKYHTLIEKVLFKYALSRATRIFVRDKFSKARLQQIFNIESEVIPDIVFYDPVKFTTKDNKAMVFVTDYNKVVKVSNNKYTREKYYLELQETIKRYRDMGYGVSLGYTTQQDACEARRFQTDFLMNDSSNIEIENVHNLSQLIETIKTCKQIYSSRMHALVLGKKYGCAVEPQIISDKILSFKEEYLAQDLFKLSNEFNNMFVHIDN